MESNKNARSRAGSIVVSTGAVFAAAAFWAVSSFGLAENPEGMDTQESEIAEALHEIDLEATGNDRDVVVDCGISNIEDRLLDNGSAGWALKLPSFIPIASDEVVHYKQSVCDDFTKRDDPNAAFSMLVTYSDFYRVPETSPCLVKFAYSMMYHGYVIPMLADASDEDIERFDNAGYTPAKDCDVPFEEMVS